VKGAQGWGKGGCHGERSRDARCAVILVVDDEITARLVTREVLINAGFSVEEAEDGDAALRAIDDVKPDIVIADVMMPIMDGFTLCKEIRRRPDGRLLPVLMVTGLDDVASIHRAYEVGANRLHRETLQLARALPENPPYGP